MSIKLNEYFNQLQKNLSKASDKFFSDMQKSYKVLVQNLSGKKAKKEDLVKI